MNPDNHIKDLVNRIIDIQATAYTSAYKTKTLELSPNNAGRSPLPEFEVGDCVLYYQHRVGGRAVRDPGLTSPSYHYPALDSYYHYLPVTKL
ncbi:hypothetical protein DSO57_1025321 [Entomophthora muscae]|uniref:Uncharacterized protein n=1 Tax=Entomophthora muscae TaxID=34485 RepID=A0ACC2RTF9_9FUNG|nr:hypothetical protein DSO57_1025321 [Entomophthora muscae]